MNIFDFILGRNENRVGVVEQSKEPSEEVIEDMGKKTTAVKENFEAETPSKKRLSDPEVAVAVLKEKGYLSDTDLARKRTELEG